MVRILIKGGKVVNDDCTQEADVYIENGIIQQVGKELMIPGGAKVIDASGKLVLPGGIDTSVHLEESFMNATTVDDFYSGTKVTVFSYCPKFREAKEQTSCFITFVTTGKIKIQRPLNYWKKGFLLMLILVTLSVMHHYSVLNIWRSNI